MKSELEEALEQKRVLSKASTLQKELNKVETFKKLKEVQIENFTIQSKHEIMTSGNYNLKQREREIEY